ncbi:MAG: DegV family protein [Lachnospiraceae bacterium]|nr:DegV family protein [Lachnospiraceae bacterium]
MNKYVITTDSTCDLPESFTKENNVDVIPVLYSVDDVVYGTPDSNMDIKDFYDAMRNGIMPTTMACNIEDCKTVFEKYAKDNIDILHLAFSSGLSSTYSNAVIAANDVMEEYPNCRITVIDTLAASMGEGLLVYKAVNLKKEGKGLDEVATYIEENKGNVISRFTVDDLHHLHRGGRVSKTTAIVGSLINVKPILHVDEEGLLKSLENVRGRKKSLARIIDMMEEATRDYNGTNDIVFLSHGDCEEDAKYIASEIEKRFGIKTMVNILGQTIGTHTGPNLIALFFMGNKR